MEEKVCMVVMQRLGGMSSSEKAWRKAWVEKMWGPPVDVLWQLGDPSLDQNQMVRG
jgi:hypothetical protein